MTRLPRSGDAAMVAPATEPSDIDPTDRRGRNRRRGGGRPLLTVLAALALMIGACGGSGEDRGIEPDPTEVDGGAPGTTYPRPTLELVDELLTERVDRDGLVGAALIVEPADGAPHLHTVGAVGPATPVPLAETSFWLVATVLLTLVDDGSVGLDEPVGAHLPWMTGTASTITLRQLLSHTSGLPLAVECDDPTPAACDAAIGASPLVHPPGGALTVTALDAHVAARLAETVTGRPWDQLFRERLADPTTMTVTTFADPSSTGGLLATDGSTTADDLGRFLDVLRDDGRAGDVEILSAGSWREMLLDQTVRLDTHDEPWVADTGVPTFGLGVWRDRLRGDDAAATVSAPNRYGLYPLVDTARDAWAIVVIDDRTLPRHDVVGASATLAQLTAAALRAPPN
ncbi:MAG TPA: serine hydrolase domain-containing protein [Acidimicrobiales bacterium]